MPLQINKRLSEHLAARGWFSTRALIISTVLLLLMSATTLVSSAIAQLPQVTSTPVSYPGAATTYLLGINDAGTAVGEYVRANGSKGVFLYQSGSFTTISVPASALAVTIPIGINNAFEILLSDFNVNASAHYAYIYNYKNGLIRTLDLSGYVVSGASHVPVVVGAASGFNDNDSVTLFNYTTGNVTYGTPVSCSGVVASCGPSYQTQFTDVPCPSPNSGVPGGISNDNVLSYTCGKTNPSGYRFSYPNATQITVPGTIWNYATSISNSGRVAGYAQNPDNTVSAYFSDSSLDYSRIVVAATGYYSFGVNTFGQVVGYSANSNGTYTGFITTDSPSTNSTVGYQFIPVTPCRIADTRTSTGPFGAPEIASGSTREFDIPQSSCGIPASATAYSLNITAVPEKALGYLSVWPTGQSQPLVSTLNSDGRTKANAAIVPAGTNGGVNVFATDASNVILDIDGYFVPKGTASALDFYPVTPCRIADTRNAGSSFGSPSIAGQNSRIFPIQNGACGLPANAQAYSLNVTAVPHSRLGFLTTWPTGQSQPNVSTLNSPTGAIVANAAIVPAGNGGSISIYVSDDADVILDVNGYFAPASAGGLLLYTASPCRVVDTRNGSGALNGVLAVDVSFSTCSPPFNSKAFVLNSTVVPLGPLGYLALWPDGQNQPLVSTLNAPDGSITSNMAIVPVANGKTDVFASSPAQVILDITSSFAP